MTLNDETPERRIEIATMGAYAMHARHPVKETTAAGTRAFLDKFEREVDPDNVLPLDERKRRAAAALKAHMNHLAVLSADARRATKTAAKVSSTKAS